MRIVVDVVLLLVALAGGMVFGVLSGSYTVAAVVGALGVYALAKFRWGARPFEELQERGKGRADGA